MAIDNETILLIIKVAVASIFGSTGLFTLIIELLRRHDKKVEKNENIVTNEELNKLVGAIEKQIEVINEEIALLKDNELAKMRQRLLELFRYYLSRGFITIDERETLAELMTYYEKFGGDGFIHDNYELVTELPFDKIA